VGRKTSLKPRKKPSQGRSRFTVEQILEGAAHVFARRGYAAATTNHIARKAGVSIGSLYQYFPNKEALLVALLEQHMHSASSILDELLSETHHGAVEIEPLVKKFLRRILDAHLRNPGLQHVLLFEAPRTAEITEAQHRLEDSMAQAVEQTLARLPGVSEQHAAHAAYLIVHVVENLAHEFVVHPPRDMDRDTFEQELTTMLCSYIHGTCAQDSGA
jgi:AcrR family transcriptional regulator